MNYTAFKNCIAGVPQNISVDLGFRNVEEGELDEDTPPGYPGTGELSPL